MLDCDVEIDLYYKGANHQHLYDYYKLFIDFNTLWMHMLDMYMPRNEYNGTADVSRAE